MEPISTKPYLLRALYEWCVDNGYTPHLLVVVDSRAKVPMSYVKNGEIVLNINPSACKSLLMENEAITFSARFNGVSTDLYIPVGLVKGIFSRENGQGMFFEIDTPQIENNVPASEEGNEPNPPPKGKPSLRVVK